MCYWDFVSIAHTLVVENRKASGKPIIKKGLTTSDKDMIARRKAQR